MQTIEQVEQLGVVFDGAAQPLPSGYVPVHRYTPPYYNTATGYVRSFRLIEVKNVFYLPPVFKSGEWRLLDDVIAEDEQRARASLSEEAPALAA